MKGVVVGRVLALEGEEEDIGEERGESQDEGARCPEVKRGPDPGRGPDPERTDAYAQEVGGCRGQKKMSRTNEGGALETFSDIADSLVPKVEAGIAAKTGAIKVPIVEG